MLAFARERPAFAKAKSGRIPKATAVCRSCSSDLSGERSGCFGSRIGMNSASAIPARVACTPDLSSETHITTPTSRYGALVVTPRRFSTKSGTISASAIASALNDRSLV